MTTMDWKELRKAAAFIRRGGLVAMPTETVYGLAADATNDQAVARVFEAKGRPQFNPLIVHVAGVEMAAHYVDFSPVAQTLAAEFWPGPLTLVLPRKHKRGTDETREISLLVSAGLDTIAIRAPKGDIAQALIKSVARPLAAPSANRSGAISPTRAQHIGPPLSERIGIVLDGGPCPVGVESTIVKIDNGAVSILRPGGVARQDIERCLGKKLQEVSAGMAPQAPGMLSSHYAPRSKLRLNASKPNGEEAFLGFGAAMSTLPHALNLSATGDLCEAAANLFAHLRALDQMCTDENLAGIAAAPIPLDGLGEAINDRLTRAAARRN